MAISEGLNSGANASTAVGREVIVIAEESPRILGKANSVGDVSPQTGNLNEALAFFSGNNTHQSFSGFTTRGSSSSGAGLGSGIGGSNFRPRKNPNSHLYCDYCNWKGHIRAQCYNLHGYPADWKGRRRPSPNSANLVGSTNSPGAPPGGGNSTTGVSHAFIINIPPAALSQQPHLSPQPQPHPHFSHQQYMQILQLLDSGHEQTDIDSRVRTTGKFSTDKWIIDSGASKNMVHNLHMLTHYKPISTSQEGRVYFPTSNLATVKHIGSSQILGGIEISNALHIPKFHYHLLYVSKLTKELNCTVLFYPDFCIF
ncbi:hypothetical protein H5410_025651 [Solanum commersonii]|uniref:Retrovirus-related Pol polyprotein from transposon TNT 1-94-like beta-barrel domain-containing protein n=1 Tax=Solanum commersonii TaxID=4109 RepID=A0A9J5YWM3_SOLCO|nr:hypothetical protein H5410_025651 [Solanum commersonii]